MKIALAQLNSNDEIEQNLLAMTKLIELACDQKPDLILFPENSLFFRLNSADEVKALSFKDSAFQNLIALVNKVRIAIHLTTALKDESGQVFNASALLRPDQKPEILYRKIHLFDIELNGQKPIRESDCFMHGEKENIFELNGFRFGSSICYDVRFSELYFKYAKQSVDVILVPAAFLVKTGEAHWQVLLRARAIESQCYVLAPAQSGKHTGNDPSQFRETYGHTMAISPWGQIVAEKNSGVGLVYVELNKNDIQSVRDQIPMKNHRRL